MLPSETASNLLELPKPTDHPRQVADVSCGPLAETDGKGPRSHPIEVKTPPVAQHEDRRKTQEITCLPGSKESYYSGLDWQIISSEPSVGQSLKKAAIDPAVV